MAEENIDDLHRQIKELENKVAYLNSQLKQENRFGLQWIDVPEAFDAESENKIPILEEVPELAIPNDDGKPTHILIEGDNYHALTCLNYTHHGKVDVIYIDPPYNTGSDGFTYKDKRFLEKFPDGAKLPTNHPLRHSSWLSYMDKRLRIAQNLLSDNGSIFISIDENELYQLKLLMDQIFGSKNFVGQWAWYKSATPPALSKKIKRNVEYILCYEKRIDSSLKYVGIQKSSGSNDPITKPQNTIKDLTFPANVFQYKGKNCIIKAGVYGTEKYPNELLNDLVIENGTNSNEVTFRNRFIWTQEKLVEEINNHTSFALSNKLVISYKKSEYSPEVPPSLINDEVNVTTTEEAGKQLESIMGAKVFDYPKPVSLIKYILSFRKASTILDFFAGSGTTMQAVMEMNQEDNGNRQCLLVQYPEPTFEIKDGSEIAKKESKVAHDEGYRFISDITRERNRRIIRGYKDKKGLQVPPLGNSLKYYRTSFVGSNASSQATDEDKTILAQKAGCLLALAENTLYEQKTTDNYQIFKDKDKDVWTAVYFKEDVRPKFFNEFVDSIKELKGQKNVYIFSWGDVGSFESYFDDVPHVHIKGIPQPILDIYKSLNS